MKALCLAAIALTLLLCLGAASAQTGCAQHDLSGYFEGTAVSKQAGKLDVSLNLHCDNGRYAGELVTPVGTYAVADGHFQTDQLHLALEAGTDKVTIDAGFHAGTLQGTFVAGDDSGSLDLRRTAEAHAPAVEAGSSLTPKQWHEDLAFLARELPRRHANAFHSLSREKFEAEVSDLDRQLDHLNSDEIYVRMDHIANLIGDGHTYIRLPDDDANFPIAIERFGNDYRVVAAASSNEKALGARVLRIEGTSIARAYELLFTLTPYDETQVLREARVTDYLTMGITLHGMRIIHDRNMARYNLADDSGQEFTLDVHAAPEHSPLDWTYAYQKPPLFRQKAGDNFWFTSLPGSSTVYCSFRGYKDLGRHSKPFFDLIRQEHPDKLVIDMRLNGGGDYNEGLKYLVHPIRDLSAINRKGHLFVLVGPGTFSAAMSNAAHFRYQTHAILVGQQIGEKPNSYQEPRQMKLPNSHWTVRYSVKFYQFVESGENLIRPDQEIVPSWDDYRSGRDPVLDWVLNYDREATTVAR
jgi:hypothetical protein